MNRQTRNIAYNYFSGILLSAIARRWKNELDVTFDKRATRVASKNSLVEYLMIKINMENRDRRRVLIRQADSRDVYGLQVADFMANTTYQRINGRNVELMARLNKNGGVHINKFPLNGFGEGDEMWYNVDGT